MANGPVTVRSLDALLPVLELQYLDETGTKGTTSVRYPLGTTVAVMDAQASALASLIAPITGCVLIRQRIIYKAVETPRSVPDTGSTIVRSGVFVFASEDEASLAIVQVPGILDEMMETTGVGAGFIINLSNPLVISLVDTIIESGVTNPFGVVMTHVLAAYRQSRS